MRIPSVVLVGAMLMASFAPSVAAQPSTSSAETAIVASVTDASGSPLKDAFVESVPRPRSHHDWLGVTDANGKVVVKATPEILIVRRAGYRSKWLPAKSATFPIALEPFEGTFPVCAPRTQCYTEYTRLCVPKRFSLKTKKWGGDDYHGTTYCLKRGPKTACFAHGYGPTWSLGFPVVLRPADVEAFEEVVYDVDRIPVVASSGIRSNSPWRFVGMIGETMQYERIPPIAKSELDEVMDAVCFRPFVGAR